jgi:hypothetical protein
VPRKVRKITRRKAPELWEMKKGNCEVKPQAIRSIVKTFIKRDGSKAPIIPDLFVLKYQHLVKAIAIADCSENQFTLHDLCDENHKQRVEARVQALLETADDTHLEKLRPCDIQKLVKSLKLRKACGLDGIPNQCLSHIPRRPCVYLTHLFNHCLRLRHFPKPWKDAKS